MASSAHEKTPLWWERGPIGLKRVAMCRLASFPAGPTRRRAPLWQRKTSAQTAGVGAIPIGCAGRPGGERNEKQLSHTGNGGQMDVQRTPFRKEPGSVRIILEAKR